MSWSLFELFLVSVVPGLLQESSLQPSQSRAKERWYHFCFFYCCVSHYHHQKTSTGKIAERTFVILSCGLISVSRQKEYDSQNGTLKHSDVIVRLLVGFANFCSHLLFFQLYPWCLIFSSSVPLVNKFKLTDFPHFNHYKHWSSASSSRVCVKMKKMLNVKLFYFLLTSLFVYRYESCF